MKELNGHLYETHKDWHTVIVRKQQNWLEELIYKGDWLSVHCPNCDQDYDAYCYHEDDFSDPNHRTAYFFRDKQVALMFALRWA